MKSKFNNGIGVCWWSLPCCEFDQSADAMMLDNIMLCEIWCVSYQEGPWGWHNSWSLHYFTEFARRPSICLMLLSSHLGLLSTLVCFEQSLTLACTLILCLIRHKDHIIHRVMLPQPAGKLLIMRHQTSPGQWGYHSASWEPRMKTAHETTIQEIFHSTQECIRKAILQSIPLRCWWDFFSTVFFVAELPC